MYVYIYNIYNRKYMTKNLRLLWQKKIINRYIILCEPNREKKLLMFV